MNTALKLARWLAGVAIPLSLLLAVTPAFAQESNVTWVEGPTLVDMGENLAQIDLGEEYLFANGADTALIMESIGNTSSGQEVGLIVPKADDESWFLLFEFDPVGYVSDDEKDKLDADAILESIRTGTEAANEDRVARGEAPMRVVGWYEAPHYDAKTNNLVWTVLGESEEDGKAYQTANHNIRLLGRTGYMSIVLVADPTELAAVRPQLQTILAGFSYKTGNKYAEYKQGDKIAEYGLTALVAGGVGAAAAKAGLFKGLFKLLAAGGKALVIAVIAIAAAIGRFFKGLFGGRRREGSDINSPYNIQS